MEVNGGVQPQEELAILKGSSAATFAAKNINVLDKAVAKQKV